MNIEDAISEKIELLQPLPETVIRIQEICQNPDSSIKDLINVVESDPLLTARLLKVANSPFYGFTSKILSISHAVALFGMNTVLGFALSSSVRKSFNNADLTPYGITTEDFIKSSFLQNKIMIMWHLYLPFKNIQVVIPASFINEIGRLILSEILIERKLHKNFMNSISALKGDDIYEIEKIFLGTTTPEVTGKILYKWCLNINMVLSIISSLNPEKSDDDLKPLGYAIKICRAAVGLKGDITRESIEDALRLVDQANFNRKDFLISIKKVTTS